MSISEEPKCMCKDRAASACPGEWEPGCDLGSNEKFVRVGGISEDIKALEEALEAINHAGNVPRYIGLVGAFKKECDPDRIRRLLAQIEFERSHRVLLERSYGEHAAKLSKAIELIREGRGIWETENFDDLVVRADELIREAGHE